MQKMLLLMCSAALNAPDILLSSHELHKTLPRSLVAPAAPSVTKQQCVPSAAATIDHTTSHKSAALLPHTLLLSQAKLMRCRRQQSCISGLLVVLMLAVAVQGSTAQLTWDKLPLFGRISKAAQAAKAAAAAITVSHSFSGKTPSLPPTPPVAAPAAPGSHAGKTPPQPAMQLLKSPADGGKKVKKGKELKQLPVTGKNETQAGCSCLAEWEAKPGGAKMSGCANPDNDPLVRHISVMAADCCWAIVQQ
jgi:hypothetical protein